jgi:hypothetical protein
VEGVMSKQIDSSDDGGIRSEGTHVQIHNSEDGPPHMIKVSKYLSDKDLLELCFEVSSKKYDGHFTLMRFSGNWRACFGPQPSSRSDIDNMMPGETLRDCLLSVLKCETTILGVLLNDEQNDLWENESNE